MKPSNPGEKSFLTTKKKGNVVINPKKEDLMKETKLEEKKAAKDYDGDGKIESGSKEHAGAVHNAIQKKKGLKPDGKDTRAESYYGSKVREKLNAMKEAAHDALRSKRAKSPKGEGAVDTAPDESNVGEETLHEISADTGLAASRAADQKRAQLAKAGDKEGAAGKAAQAKRLYDAQAKKRLKETEDRIKERMIQFTKDHDNQMSGKQPI